MDLELSRLNLTRVDLSWVDPYATINGDISTKVCLAVFMLSYSSTGTILQLILISFEHFGGDPQKRSLLNQVMSIVVNTGNCPILMPFSDHISCCNNCHVYELIFGSSILFVVLHNWSSCI